MIISILNIKGGVGKTTLSTNLAVGLKSPKTKVLIIDTDIQQSASEWSNQRKIEGGLSEIDVISICESKKIEEKIEDLDNRYDYIIIDGCPQLNDLARFTMVVSDLVIFPVQPSPFDLWAAFNKIQANIDIIKKNVENFNYFFVMNRMVTGTNISKEALEVVSETFPVLKTLIHQRIAYVEAAMSGRSVLELSDKKAVAEFKAFVAEVKKKAAVK